MYRVSFFDVFRHSVESWSFRSSVGLLGGFRCFSRMRSEFLTQYGAPSGGIRMTDGTERNGIPAAGVRQGTSGGDPN